MKHQRQGRFECGLATLAMIADIPLDTVREFALRDTGVDSWRQLPKNLWWERFYATWEHFSGQSILLQGLDLSVGGPIGATSLLAGKGFVVIRIPGQDRHMVAYEDGQVFDGAEETSFPFDVWWARYLKCAPTAYIERIESLSSSTQVLRGKDNGLRNV